MCFVLLLRHFIYALFFLKLAWVFLKEANALMLSASPGTLFGLTCNQITSQASEMWLLEMELAHGSQILHGWCVRVLGLLFQWQPIWWLNRTQMYSLPVLEARSLKSRCQHVWFFLEAVRETLIQASLLATSGCPQSLVSLGLRLYHCCLCLHLPVAFSPSLPVSVCHTWVYLSQGV